MTDFLMIFPLCDFELDAVTGGNNNYYVQIRQNAKGRDIIVSGANGVSVAMSGVAMSGVAMSGVARSGVGGVATAAAGGAGGTNTITSHP